MEDKPYSKFIKHKLSQVKAIRMTT